MPKIDYKRLLEKYMYHVDFIEGSTFTTDLGIWSEIQFSDNEKNELLKIAKQIDDGDFR